MATKKTLSGASGGFGGMLAGLNAGLESDNKNRFKRIEKEEDRRFQLAKAIAVSDNKFNREQNFAMPAPGQEFGQLTQKQLFDQNEKNRKINSSQDFPSMDELAALKSGKLTGDKYADLSPDQAAEIIKEIARRYGYQNAADREEVEDEGFLGIGRKTRKVPTYAAPQNQFQR